MSFLSKSTLEAQWNSPFSAVIAFGDSISDNGFLGGHGFRRYTNTWTWVEYLAQLLGLPLDCWAHGGAMTDEGNEKHPAPEFRWSGLAWQVRNFASALEPSDDLSRVLFTVMCGANDFWGGQKSGALSAKNLLSALEALVEAGARNLLFREMSALVLSPVYLEGEYSHLAQDFRNFIIETNQTAKDLIKNKFLNHHPNVNLFYLPSDPLFTKIREAQPGFTFQILDQSWLDTYSYPEPFKYLWWDAFHPMGELHLLMAQDSLKALQNTLSPK
ncbi:MAG: hypothetical protein LBE80_03675 [Deltaproteobacteria bacterium]|jgi:phospholipase/lecithinase/hemolysin|nr:hypothetical protein [Deltaproteobacteria bacterium]